jgi:hypothetical protein
MPCDVHTTFHLGRENTIKEQFVYKSDAIIGQFVYKSDPAYF